MCQQISNYLIDSQILQPNEQIQFEFGLDVITHNCIISLCCLLVGIVLNDIYITILLLITFSILRKHVDGIHAESKIKCIIISLCTYYMVLWMCSVFSTTTLQIASLIIMVFEAKCQDTLLCQYSSTNINNILCICFYLGSISRYLYCVEFAEVQFILIIIIGGEHIIMKQLKSIPQQIHTIRIMRILTSLVLMIGAYAVHSPCTIWNYKFEIPEELRKL